MTWLTVNGSRCVVHLTQRTRVLWFGEQLLLALHARTVRLQQGVVRQLQPRHLAQCQAQRAHLHARRCRVLACWMALSYYMAIATSSHLHHGLQHCSKLQCPPVNLPLQLLLPVKRMGIHHMQRSCTMHLAAGLGPEASWADASSKTRTSPRASVRNVSAASSSRSPIAASSASRAANQRRPVCTRVNNYMYCLRGRDGVTLGYVGVSVPQNTVVG